MPRPSLAIVDDHELFRQGLQALLADDFEIVGVGATSAEALDLCVKLHPDLILLDVELGSDPAEVTVRSIRRLAPSVTVVVLTMFNDAVLKRQLLAAGASDYLTKSIDRKGLSASVMQALTNGPAFMTSDVAEESTLLSRRELEVLRLIAAAASNRDIALQLLISEGTVKRHIANIYTKIGAVSRVDAVTKATRHGLLRH